MAAIPAGFPKSTTIEDTLLEAAELIEAMEASTVSNPQGTDNMSVSYSANGTATVSFTVPVTKTISTTGRVEISATEYLT